MRNNQQAFTLIEVILVIILIGILSGIVFVVLRGPMTQYVQMEQRTAIVDIAETALLRMTREIRLALPNSVRVSGSTSLEFLRTSDGGRYRENPGGAAAVCPGGNPAAQDVLRFSSTTDCFEVFGGLFTVPAFNAAANQATCRAAGNTSDCVVIYNTGQPADCTTAADPCANAYCGCNMAGITDATANYIDFDISGSPLGSPPASFPFRSPQQRFQIIDMPVSFVCAGSEITRYADYDISAAQPVSSGDFGTALENNLLVNQVSSCSFNYAAGSATRAGLVTISLTIRDDDLNQEVTLLQQAHVDNLP